MSNLQLLIILIETMLIFQVNFIYGSEYKAPMFGYRVIASFPHDSNAFTQGLIYTEGKLFEGTGLYGKSMLRQVDLTTGQIKQKQLLAPFLFGEGITEWKGSIIQLTWREGKALIYDSKTLNFKNKFNYPGEGWGLTQDGQQLIMSDGTAWLRFINPQSYQIIKKLLVHDGNNLINYLNELEWIKNTIWANIWRTEKIAWINPSNGIVTGYLNLTGLTPISLRNNPDAVLNGIAYDAQNDRIFITGKFWPKLYQIQVKN